MSRMINDAGIAIIKEHEGCRLIAYPDPGSGGDPWTIGFGHTGPDVTEGTVISQDGADTLLESDLVQFCAEVSADVPDGITENQFSALISFAYNEGEGRLRSSTLLAKLRTGDMQGAADQFPLWDKSCGKVLPGLVARRAAERALFLTPDA